jgi:hypothetical protein
MASDERGVAAMTLGAPVSVATTLFPDPGPGEAVVRVRACPMPRRNSPTLPANGDDIEIGAETRHIPGWLRHVA